MMLDILCINLYILSLISIVHIVFSGIFMCANSCLIINYFNEGGKERREKRERERERESVCVCMCV